MEYSKPLAVESFSNSWLKNMNSSLDVLEEPVRASQNSSYDGISKDLAYETIESRRALLEVQNSKFDFNIPHSSAALVHADELFSDGLIKPVFINRSDMETFTSLSLVPSIPSSFSSRTVVSAVRVQCQFFGRWKQILRKCFRYARPLCLSLRGSRKGTRVDDIGIRAWEVKSQRNSPKSSPGGRISYATNNFSDTENSIYEAILHCKRSMDK